ncbi:MAG: N-acetylglucosamine-6-phosphate deacetylase, partial [Oscillospiraceae bacterium]
MIIINANYLDENFQEQTGDIEIADGRILRVGKALSHPSEDLAIDCTGYTIVPGFVDIHTHGCVGCDASDGDKDAVLAMAKFLVSKGVTTFCPTTMT